MLNSSPGKYTRQQLYDLIRETSKDEYILSEMVRLGFWNENEGQPSLPAELIQQKGALERELQELLKKQRRYSNPEQALKDLHKERKKEALKRREETKQKNNAKRFQRASNWRDKNQREITFLGKGYSAGLQGRFTDRDRLARQNLPVFESAMDLAQAMGISINELRFLSFGRKTSKITHYRQFLIAKKTGGTRRISAPMPRLKRLQYWILDTILSPITLHESAHGFVPKRSIVTNAGPHVNSDVVVNMDLKDFFPTITYKRIKGLFCNLGYNEHVSTILALLCSEPDVSEVELDRETYFVAKGERHLPQGAPTSPAISNLLCRKLDARMMGITQKLGFTYTRYADDLTYSGSRKAAHHLSKLFWRVEKIVEDEGFVIQTDKTRIMRSNNRQEVTGIVVNKHLSIDRNTLKRFRALLHHIEMSGLEGKRWGNGSLIPSIEGYANFVNMVNPQKGLRFQQQIAAIKKKYGYHVEPQDISDLNKKRMRIKAAEGMPPRPNWWLADPPPPPIPEFTPEQLKQINTAQHADETVSSGDENPVHVPVESRTSTTRILFYIILFALFFVWYVQYH